MEYASFFSVAHKKLTRASPSLDLCAKKSFQNRMNELEDRSLGVQRLAGEKLHFIGLTGKMVHMVAILNHRINLMVPIESSQKSMLTSYL